MATNSNTNLGEERMAILQIIFLEILENKKR